MIERDARAQLALRCNKDVIFNAAGYLADYACKGHRHTCPVQHCKHPTFECQASLCSHLLADHFQSVKALAAVIKQAASTAGHNQLCPFKPATSIVCECGEAQDWILHMEQQHISSCWIAAQKLHRSFVYEDLPFVTKSTAKHPQPYSVQHAQTHVTKVKSHTGTYPFSRASRIGALEQNDAQASQLQWGHKVAAMSRDMMYPCPLGCQGPTMPAWQIPDHVLSTHFDWLVQWVSESRTISERQHPCPTGHGSKQHHAAEHDSCTAMQSHASIMPRVEVEQSIGRHADVNLTQQHAIGDQQLCNVIDSAVPTNDSVKCPSDDSVCKATEQQATQQDIEPVAESSFIMKTVVSSDSSNFSPSDPVLIPDVPDDCTELNEPSQTCLHGRLESLVQTFDLEYLLHTDQGLHEQDLPLLLGKYHKAHLKPLPSNKGKRAAAKSTATNQQLHMSSPHDPLNISWEEQVRSSLSSPSIPVLTSNSDMNHRATAKLQTLKTSESKMVPGTPRSCNVNFVPQGIHSFQVNLVNNNNMVTTSLGSPSSKYQQPAHISPGHMQTDNVVDQQVALNVHTANFVECDAIQANVSRPVNHLSKEELFARAEVMISGSSWDE